MQRNDIIERSIFRALTNTVLDFSFFNKYLKPKIGQYFSGLHDLPNLIFIRPHFTVDRSDDTRGLVLLPMFVLFLEAATR